MRRPCRLPSAHSDIATARSVAQGENHHAIALAAMAHQRAAASNLHIIGVRADGQYHFGFPLDALARIMGMGQSLHLRAQRLGIEGMEQHGFGVIAQSSLHDIHFEPLSQQQQRRTKTTEWQGILLGASRHIEHVHVGNDQVPGTIAQRAGTVIAIGAKNEVKVEIAIGFQPPLRFLTASRDRVHQKDPKPGRPEGGLYPP